MKAQKHHGKQSQRVLGGFCKIFEEFGNGEQHFPLAGNQRSKVEEKIIG